jgi:hypothetical protein
MSAEITPIRRRDPRDRLNVQAAPPALPFMVMVRGEVQLACATEGEATDAAEALALKIQGQPVQLLRLVNTFQTAIVVRRTHP